MDIAAAWCQGARFADVLKMGDGLFEVRLAARGACWRGCGVRDGGGMGGRLPEVRAAGCLASWGRVAGGSAGARLPAPAVRAITPSGTPPRPTRPPPLPLDDAAPHCRARWCARSGGWRSCCVSWRGR